MKRPIALVILAAMMLLTPVVVTGQAQAKVAGPIGQIVFTRAVTDRSEEAVIYVANPDGTHMHELLPGLHSEESPYWSPDGSQIAVLSGLGQPCCTVAAVIVDPDTGAYRVLTMPDPSLFTACVVWSPDAQRLACAGFGNEDPSRNGIYSIRTSDGQGLTRITSNPGGGDFPLDYSPNGEKIVFGRTDPSGPDGENHNQALFVVNVNGSGLHRITPWGFYDEQGSWSPDGSKIAFEHRGSIFTVHPDGTGLGKIPLAVAGPYGAGDIVWSPDGTKIAFLLVTQTGQEGIATANADGSDVKQVTISPTFDHQADWGPHPLAT